MQGAGSPHQCWFVQCSLDPVLVDLLAWNNVHCPRCRRMHLKKRVEYSLSISSVATKYVRASSPASAFMSSNTPLFSAMIKILIKLPISKLKLCYRKSVVDSLLRKKSFKNDQKDVFFLRLHLTFIIHMKELHRTHRRVN